MGCEGGFIGTSSLKGTHAQVQLISSGEKCPMCSDNIDKKSVQLVEDPSSYLYPEGED